MGVDPATKFFSFGDAAVEILAVGPKLGWLLARRSSLVGEGLRGDGSCSCFIVGRRSEVVVTVSRGELLDCSMRAGAV